MKKLYVSHKMESLCQKLAHNLKKQAGSIFSPSMIITQGGGMNAWLTTQLAMENGVFAHYAFQNQDGFMGQVNELLLGATLPGNIDNLRFAIYGLLGSPAFTESFPKVAEYYRENELRRMQLASRIADLFDQYQLYRAELPERWNADALLGDHTAEPWQKWLWRALALQSRAESKKTLLEKISTQDHLLKDKWPEIHLFGIAIYTDYHRDFYQQLASFVDVHFYVCLPTQHKSFQHTLLEGWGRKALELMQGFEGIAPEFQEYSPGNHTTLLGRLQQSIVLNTDLDDNTSDDSIQVHCCHTPVREVESLYNYLLDLFEKHKGELKASDILVVAPDINVYAPLVKAVFRNAPVKLPVKVSGAASNADDSMTAALELIMNLREDDFTLSQVLGILEHNRIRKAFQIQDFAYVRQMADKAGIRFGRENRKEDDTHFVSWKYGLDKIILGYAMLSGEAFEDIFPFQDAEAAGSYDLLRLKAFVDALQNLLDYQQKTLTLTEWRKFFLEEIVEKMVWSNPTSKDDRLEVKEIYKSLGYLKNADESLRISYEVFLSELAKALFGETRAHHFNSGRITLTSALQARGIPHKVIAFLGLDNGVFPRKDQFLGFDLMGDAYRPGDRSKAEADKFLFLDFLMGAREKLYLSYIGRSVKDNTVLSPSILLDTLMDYLDMQPVVHPLHGFSAKYDGQKLFTYLYGGPSQQFLFQKNADTVADEPVEADLPHFLKFFEAPIDWYFNHVLGISYAEKNDIISDTELFDLDHLQQWMIKNYLMGYDGSLQSFIDRGVKNSLLPLKNAGHLVAAELMAQTEPVKETFVRLLHNHAPQSVLIDLKRNSCRITGTLGPVFNNSYIAYTFSDNQKYRVSAALKTLLLCTQLPLTTSMLILKNGDVAHMPVYPPGQALERLDRLMEIFMKGNQRPLKFTLSAVRKPSRSELTSESVVKAFQNEAFPYYRNGMPPNKYIRVLLDEGYLQDFTDEDMKQLMELKQLLHL
ncbi:MAG: exodeoxyribonuclease V subunit gamma [Bacteroidales bacterium]